MGTSFLFKSSYFFLKLICTGIETNECLPNNGGCWQDKASNATACKVLLIVKFLLRSARCSTAIKFSRVDFFSQTKWSLIVEFVGAHLTETLKFHILRELHLL